MMRLRHAFADDMRTAAALTVLGFVMMALFYP